VTKNKSAYENTGCEILVVDDDPDNLQTLCDILTEAGYQTLPAANGTQALILIESHVPAGILLDINMPGMDGFEICRRLKSDERTKDIPVIFISAYTETGEIVKAFESGGEDYISKPFHAREILARIQIHIKLHNQQVKLENRVRQQTSELQIINSKIIKKNKQLRQAQKMEAIGSLAGGIAHDFNNILAVILGYAELSLEDTVCPPNINQSLTQIKNAALRSKNLVEQILSFSHQAEQKKTPLEIIPLIKEVCKFIRSSLPTTIDIKQDLSSKHDTIMADPTQIYQVLMNLCTNAAHAMKDRVGVLKIALDQITLNGNTRTKYPGLGEGQFLKLIVVDTGQGIKKEHLPHLFESFFTTKKVGEGTGLGLSVVNGIIHDLGGEISVESEVGKGTTFQVLLPLLDEKKTFRKHSGKASVPRGKETILFVDDEKGIVDVAKRILERLNYTVVGVTCPEKALERFEQEKERFDLVVTDKSMPNMDGFDLARQIKERCSEIPIIICSGSQDDTDMDKIKSAKINDFVLKPLNRRDMAETIRRVLDEKEKTSCLQ
jgi:CheY-like chemotaxis protein/two-component sensor histidine kinase